jgi:hypothetical protein
MSPANFVHHSSGHPELIDVLDRVLDKGIVIIYDIDVSLAGLRVIGFTGNVVIASIETYRRMTDDAVIQAQHSPALSHATDEFLRRVHTSTKSDGAWDH